MTRDRWADDALCQLWAEGIDWPALVPSVEAALPSQIEEWLQRRDTLPLREPFKYPSPEKVRIGAPLVAHFVDRDSFVPWVARLCGGALRGIGAAQAENGQRDRIAHWRLNLALGRRFPNPEDVVQHWDEHPNQVQDTPAEQRILRWYRNHEPWLGRWHPYREGSGAMRRAPIWGAIYRVPEQAAMAAAGDARTAYGGWGIWAAAVVAHAVSGLPRDWTPQDAIRGILHATTRIDPQWPGIADLHTLLQTTYPGSSWDAWRRVIDTEFAGYPSDHSLPNLLLMLGVLHWYPTSDPEDVGPILQAAGWDAWGNRFVAGALRGSFSDHPDINRVVLNRLVESVVSAHGHPPHV
ncbi:MAG: hypothetical protein C7B46_01525 [Sulfobacillus benefaciens]|uniref:ADP-ribosylglycohydrolase family protein n=1 Tax=Sulfobacillus benefaciens TaxID=453960 RepID=A0A2T2XLM3_9FIRM|nr:MAG: hypothetical protein C7B46_01525 [Sulfobacillus benefaciens]